MNKIVSSIFAALLLTAPFAIAASDNYWYYTNPSAGSGRTYESYQRTYDTTRSDISNRNIASANSAINNGYGYYGYYDFPGYPSSYNSWSFSDNYNSQYTEKTNELIKVDKYVAYDNQGVVYPKYGDLYYGYRHPYYYSVVNSDVYGFRYPYAGLSTGDRGFYPQTYYSNTVPQEIAVPLPTYGFVINNDASNGSSQPYTVVCPQTRSSSVLTLAKSDDGPSQTYGNTITDRGVLGGPQRPITQTRITSPIVTVRNLCDRSVYNMEPQRDSMYIQAYTRK